MTTTTDIAIDAHGYTGPKTCHTCGTPYDLHFLQWANPATGESGSMLECCACGIAAGDPPVNHADCEPDERDEPVEADEPNIPAVQVFHRGTGWVMPDYTDLEPCTTNFHREQDGRPPCTGIAVWKVVEHGTSVDGYPMLTIGFYCDADLPAEHRAA